MILETNFGRNRASKHFTNKGLELGVECRVLVKTVNLKEINYGF